MRVMVKTIVTKVKYVSVHAWGCTIKGQILAAKEELSHHISHTTRTTSLSVMCSLLM